jgi:glycine/D-amino acid oxidase-like deaminating enzyme/Rieske Fe-S protein
MAFTTNPYWSDNAPAPRFAALKEDIAVDVLVIGAGMTGVTAAYLLKRAGYHVALVERNRCLSGDTACTTAHLTCVTDVLLSDLVKNFGRDHAQAVWDSQLAAIDTIDRIAWREQIKCQFEWVPAYLYRAEREPRAVDLAGEAALATELGFDAQYVDRAPLVHRAGVRYDNQAKFHPRKYLLGLLRMLGSGKGCQVFEQTNVDEIEGTPITATTSTGARIHCEHVLIATHVPLQGKSDLIPAALLQSKLAPYSTYAIGGWVPRGTAHEALYWDTGDPYDYLRIDRRSDHDFVIAGGEDHKTGQFDDTRQCFQRLEPRLKALLPQMAVTHRWSGQVIETNDGLPYIGETAERQYVATGFAGNGLTFGTLSAMMFADHVMGEENPWAKLYDVNRTKVKGGTWNYLKENKDYPYYLIRDRFAGSGRSSLRAVPRGRGEIVEVNGEMAAVYRGLDGRIQVRSATCTHLGCYVHFNDAERTWDCPCHGSRFRVNGEVLAGPAETPLEEVEGDRRQSSVDSHQSSVDSHRSSD